MASCSTVQAIRIGQSTWTVAWGNGPDSGIQGLQTKHAI